MTSNKFLFKEVKYHPVEIIAKMLKSFWAVNKTGLNSYSVSNIMMIDFKLPPILTIILFELRQHKIRLTSKCSSTLGFRYYLPLSFTLSLFDRYQLHSCGFLVIDSIGLDGLVSYNHLFIFVLGFSLTFLGAFNHCQRRIQLQCKFFMIYFMKILPTMYSSLFDCWFFAL